MKQNDLTQGSIGKGILVFLLPLLASTLIQQLYNTVDLIFVGKFCSTEATAAIGASSLIITCLIGFFNGMAVGTNVVAAHIYGKQDKKGLKNVIQTVFMIGLIGIINLKTRNQYILIMMLIKIAVPMKIIIKMRALKTKIKAIWKIRNLHNTVLLIMKYHKLIQVKYHYHTKWEQQS